MRDTLTYSLPFRAPQRVATTVHACARCGQDLLLLIFGDQARDEEGLLAYDGGGRMEDERGAGRGGETPCAGSALPRQRSTLSDHGPLAP